MPAKSIFFITPAKSLEFEKFSKLVSQDTSLHFISTSYTGNQTELSFNFYLNSKSSDCSFDNSLLENNSLPVSLWYRGINRLQGEQLFLNDEERFYLHSSLNYKALFIEVLETRFFSVNKHRKASLINNKLYQLEIAQKLGFNVPHTLISTNPDDINDFIKNHSALIIKSISTNPYIVKKPSFKRKNLKKFLSGNFIEALTNTFIEEQHYKFLTLDFNDKAASNLTSYPVILQEKVKKQYELRITVVGKKLFAAKLLSQHKPETATDFRADIYGIPLEHYEMPDRLEELCLKFCEFFQVDFGAFDFIVDNADTIYFLEFNTNAGYLWIENQLQLPVSQHIVKYLEDNAFCSSIAV